MINKIIFNIGTFLFNKDVFKSYKFLIESDKWNLDKLKEHQYHECRELLEQGYYKTEFYKVKFDEIGVTLDDFKTLEDLRKFPILTKDELRANIDKIQITDGFRKLRKAKTSGSTGQTIYFKRNSEWDARNRAAIFRGYSWHGVNPWDKNGYFWGYDISPKAKIKTKILDLLQNRFRMFSYEEKEFNMFIEKLKNATYLEGYSSAIYEIAKKVNDNNIDKFKFKKLKMVKATSEKIFEKYREEVKNAFGLELISEYGAAEAGIIAFSCECGNMHIVMENVIVEEENGEIIVTNLVSKSFPIIRYKLGDYIQMDLESKCSCGRSTPIIKDVVGRVGKPIYGMKNKYPSSIVSRVFKTIYEHGLALNYQCIQEEKEKINIKIDSKISDECKQKIYLEFNKYFNDDVIVNILDNTPILRTKGKLRNFISLIDE